MCSHDSLVNIHLQLSTYLSRDNNNHGNAELNNIIELAIIESPHDVTWSPVTSDTSPELHQFVIQQSQIGWVHLFRGRLTKSLAKFMDLHYRSLNVDTRRYNGKWWCKLLIINVWNTVLKLWKQQNDIIHRTSDSIPLTRAHERLEHRIRKCYEWREQLLREDREKLFYMK
jgi:hypothetical protein